MRDQAAHYDIIREKNKRLIRNLVRDSGTVSKTELTESSGLSFPTISAVLKELLSAGEIKSLPGNSSGGRPGIMFRLNPDYATVVCAVLKEYDLYLNIYDYCGNHFDCSLQKIDVKADELSILHIFKGIKEKYPKLCIVVMGIAGVAINGVVKHLPYLPELEEKDLGNLFQKELNTTLFLENDSKMIAMGELTLASDFVHILWNQGCIGSAIILDGKLFRGFHGCAGELELTCNEKGGKIACLQQAIHVVVSVLDVPVIAISGDEVTKEDVEALQTWIESQLALFRQPKLVYVPDENKRFEEGLWQTALSYCKQMV